jgi:DNA-binding transcriptional LysR family regulator
MIHPGAITLKQLRALLAVVECGGVASAAERLGVTPPAVSTQLRVLEATLGGPLFRRPGMKLTEIGEEVLRAAARVDATVEGSIKRLDALKAGRSGRVVLGAVSTGKYFAPHLVALLRRQAPGVEVALRVGNRREVIEGLACGRIDIAVMGRPPREPAVEAHVLGEHPHVWIAAPDHPLVSAGRVGADRLLDELVLSRESGSGTRMLLERLLDRAGGGRAYERLEFDSNETIKQAAMAGLGVALISAHTVVAELGSRRLALLDVEGAPIMRRWFALHLAAEPLSPAGRAVLDFIIGCEGGFLPRLAALDEP